VSATSSRHAPWYIVPADDKPNARLIVSRIILDTLEGLNLAYPKSDSERQKELRLIRQRLLEEK
jgi:hypothetical protein